MKAFKQVVLSSGATIIDALRVIDESGLEVALIANSKQILMGTITDGDIRRALLKNGDLHQPVKNIMNINPITAHQGTPEDEILFLMSQRSIKQVPVVDSKKKIIDLLLLKELIQKKKRPNWAVVMAGGLGKRLGKLTQTTPKPLLPVGNRPLLGTLISQLQKHGFQRIFVAVNFEAPQIKSYLKDGKDFGVSISYLEEREFLGTAGALSLLPEKPRDPFLVVNGDILTTVNFANLLHFHDYSKRAMTLCIREFNFQIPYGIVKFRGTELSKIQEKPGFNFFINSGIYVVSPEALSEVPSGCRFDMTQLVELVLKRGAGVGCFPLSEFWMDIGHLEDYQKAQMEYMQRFFEESEE